MEFVRMFESPSLEETANIAMSERTGKWTLKGYDYAICSECGGSSGTQFDGVERLPRTTAFCANCGARMTPYKGGDTE